MTYLFIGQDNLAKDAQLKKIREDFLKKETAHFNIDSLYARDLSLKEIQEKLLCLPVDSPKRLIVVKGAENLKEDIKEFILRYLEKPYQQVILILDAGRYEKRDKFFNQVSNYAKVIRFKEVQQADVFGLSRQIELRNTGGALRLLAQLLEEGERPERILGGLRYAWERDIAYSRTARKRMRLLLNCDVDIKTGRLRASFALEKLVMSLSVFVEPLA